MGIDEHGNIFFRLIRPDSPILARPRQTLKSSIRR